MSPPKAATSDHSLSPRQLLPPAKRVSRSESGSPFPVLDDLKPPFQSCPENPFSDTSSFSTPSHLDPACAMSAGNERFNAEAAAWDSKPNLHRASALALQSILEQFPQLRNRDKGADSGADVLEIGCGTGLLSFMIAPYVRSLTAVDTARGMIDAFHVKLAKQRDVRNVLPVCAMLEDPDDVRIRRDPLDRDAGDVDVDGLPPRRFDLVISHLVLHHIPSLESMFSTMHVCLKSGGSVALTDFEDFGPEAKRFHPEARMAGVERHGIQRQAVAKQLRKAGFTDVRIETAFEMEKGVETRPGEGIVEGEHGSKMTFPFLICIAKKE